MNLKKPEIIFTLIILVVGLALIVITPIGANFDEETYVARIFEMGLGHIMPNSYLGEGRNYPLALFSNSYRQDVNLWPIDGPTWLAQSRVRMAWQNREFDTLLGYTTRAVYFPTLFALQAPIMRYMGPRFDIPIVFIYYALRLSYLLIYALLVYLALRLIPFGKWVLGVIAITPMSLILASSVSPDPVIFGVIFLFIGWVMHLINDSTNQISRRQFLITGLLVLAVCSLKPNTFFLLFLLLALPRSKFKHTWHAWGFVGVSAIGVAMSLGWTYLASQVVFNQHAMASDSLPRFWSLFLTPQIFLKALYQTIGNNGIAYLVQMVGVSGYGYWQFPTFVYILFPFAILAAFFIEEKKNTLNSQQKWWFFCVGILNFLVIFVLFFVVDTPIDSPVIPGVQGRYFIPFLPLILLPLVFAKPIKGFKIAFFTLTGLLSIAFLSTLFLDYHVICGGSMLTGQPCKLPYYKNWGTETFLPLKLEKGAALYQNFIADCQTITQVDVWPLANLTGSTTQIEVNIRDGAGDLLSTQSFSTVGIPVNGWFTFDIPDVEGMKGTALTIEILPAEGGDAANFALGVFPTDEYNKGELFIRDAVTGKSTTAGNDLIFKVECE